MGERMKGGAVNEDRSPEKDAMDLRNVAQLLFCAEGTASPTFSLGGVSAMLAVSRRVYAWGIFGGRELGDRGYGRE